jgi:FLVCR family feline leukemia virus subgroup C receptor-related protein
MIAVFFPLKPNNPPSASVGVRLLKESVSILEIVRNFRTLITSNFHFFLLVIEYGILISGFNLWATFLQVVLEPSHPDDLQIGWCGFISTVASLLGSAFFPYIASKYANYRWTNISLALLACLFSAVFMVLSINPSVSWIWIHISASLLNIVFGGMLAFGIEFAAELAYPTEENLSANTVVASSQLFATVFIETLSLSQASALQILIFIICTSALSLSISAFIPNKILRYQFDKENPEISDSDVSHGGDSLSALIKN